MSTTYERFSTSDSLDSSLQDSASSTVDVRSLATEDPADRTRCVVLLFGPSKNEDPPCKEHIFPTFLESLKVSCARNETFCSVIGNGIDVLTEEQIVEELKWHYNSDQVGQDVTVIAMLHGGTIKYSDSQMESMKHHEDTSQERHFLFLDTSVSSPKAMTTHDLLYSLYVASADLRKQHRGLGKPEVFLLSCESAVAIEHAKRLSPGYRLSAASDRQLNARATLGLCNSMAATQDEGQKVNFSVLDLTRRFAIKGNIGEKDGRSCYGVSQSTDNPAENTVELHYPFKEYQKRCGANTIFSPEQRSAAISTFRHLATEVDISDTMTEIDAGVEVNQEKVGLASMICDLFSVEGDKTE